MTGNLGKPKQLLTVFELPSSLHSEDQSSVTSSFGVGSPSFSSISSHDQQFSQRFADLVLYMQVSLVSLNMLQELGLKKPDRLWEAKPLTQACMIM